MVGPNSFSRVLLFFFFLLNPLVLPSLEAGMVLETRIGASEHPRVIEHQGQGRLNEELQRVYGHAYDKNASVPLNWYYHRARYRALGLRRWASRDPIGHEGGWNLYGFVGGRPLRSRDPTGLENIYIQPDGTYDYGDPTDGVGGLASDTANPHPPKETSFEQQLRDLGIDGDIAETIAMRGAQGRHSFLVGWAAFFLSIKAADAIGAALAGWCGRGAGAAGAAEEILFRTMSRADYEFLLRSGRVRATAETFTSPTASFAANYDGVLVMFRLRAGTVNALRDIGVRDGSKLVANEFPGMASVHPGWAAAKAFFKAEGRQINIGLGRGAGLETFNRRIVSFVVVPK